MEKKIMKEETTKKYYNPLYNVKPHDHYDDVIHEEGGYGNEEELVDEDNLDECGDIV